MSPEDQKYYEDYETLFSSKEWKQFLDDIEKLSDIEKENVWKYGEPEHMLLTSGYIRGLNMILNYQGMIENNYKMLKEEETDNASL